MKYVSRLVTIGITAGLGLLTLVGSYHKTDPTEVGVRTLRISPFGLFGKKGVVDKIYQPGSTYFFPPVINEWDTFDTKLTVVEMSGNTNEGDRDTEDDLAFKTRDGNDINLDVVFSYRVNPEKAPHIRKLIASDNEELKEKVFRTVARSRPRDLFGELSTEEFYNAENRNKAAEKAKTSLDDILTPYGIIVEKVAPKDYRFNAGYQQAITDKKLADAQTLEIRSQIHAQEEFNKKLLRDAEGNVNKMRAEVDGKFQEAKLKSDAYFDQQSKIAEAILIEGKAEADALAKTREAMASEGGVTKVKMAVASSLQGKRIVMVPSGGNMDFNLRTLDINKFLSAAGLDSGNTYTTNNNQTVKK